MPGDPKLRASDADRDRTVELLREHHAVGRITAEEYDHRLNQVFAAKTLGSELLADLPAIDLYQLPSAGIRQDPRAVRVRSRRSGLDRPGDGSLLPRQSAAWGTYAVVSALLTVAWVIIGATTGGLAWLPWFLLIVIPWGLAIARRPQP
jgi:hypothetical protein